MTAPGRLSDGEIRRIVEVEVQNQLQPLRQAVEQQGRTLRSLYSNGSGGPPGYLEKAREEDNGRFERIFDKLERLRSLEDFVVGYKATEEQREKDRQEQAEIIAAKLDKSEKKLNHRLSVGSFVVGVCGFILACLMGYLTYRDSQRKAAVVPPPVVQSSQQKSPQSAELPASVASANR